MNRVGCLLLTATGCVLAFGDGASAQDARRAERLRGSNENPPVLTDATGTFRASFFGDRIEFRLSYADLAVGDSDVTQAHLHIANPGNNGGIVAFLCSNLGNTPPVSMQRDCPSSTGVVEGTITADDVLTVTAGDPAVTIIDAADLEGLARLMRQGAVYANVHSDDFPAGEIRGQVSPRAR